MLTEAVVAVEVDAALIVLWLAIEKLKVSKLVADIAKLGWAIDIAKLGWENDITLKLVADIAKTG